MGAGPKVIVAYPVFHRGPSGEVSPLEPLLIITPTARKASATEETSASLIGTLSRVAEERLKATPDHHHPDCRQEKVHNLGDDIEGSLAKDGHNPAGTPQGHPDDPEIRDKGRKGGPESLTIQEDNSGGQDGRSNDQRHRQGDHAQSVRREPPGPIIEEKIGE